MSWSAYIIDRFRRDPAQFLRSIRNFEIPKSNSKGALLLPPTFKEGNPLPIELPTMSLTNCRFYEEKYPEIDSFVMVNVKQIAEMGAYVKLLEYDSIDGMILLSELSRRRIRSIQKLIRVGRNEVVVVLRVDKEKGYIDLSKRRVSPEDIVKCEERFNKGKMVASIMRHVAEKTRTPMETLYQSIGWPLNKKYGHAVDAFKLSITYVFHSHFSPSPCSSTLPSSAPPPPSSLR